MNIEAVDTRTFKDKEAFFKKQTGNDFIFFYNKYYSKLVYYITRICNDPQKAQDVTTDTFLLAMDRIHKYDREKAQFSTWLFTIGRNLILQEMKVDKKTVSIDIEFDNEGTTMKDFIKVEEDRQDTITELKIKKGQIMLDHINNLKTPFKTVIEMRDINQMSYNEIAEKLDENLNTIKSKIRNGRIKLKDSTRKEFELLDKKYL